MTNKEDALRCAAHLQAGADDPMWASHTEMPKAVAEKSAAHIRHLVAENEALSNELRVERETLARCKSVADTTAELWKADNEAQAALLRQAVYALVYHTLQTRPIGNSQEAIAAIRQHLEGRA